VPGTLLLDDWRQAVEDQLTQHARQAFQVVGNPPPAPDPQQILNELQSHAAQAAQQAQQGVAQFAQQRQQDAAAVGQQLQDYAQQASQGINQFNQPPLAGGPSQPPPSTVVSGVTPFEQPPPQPAPIAAPAATPHEPSPPIQTPGTQIANAPGSSGQVFPLSVKPDNTPTATYHSQGGSDLMAPRGTPVLNMQSGAVQEVFTDNGSHQVGGNAVLVHGDDGLDYYYAHFDQPSAVKVGQRVSTGEQIGAVGNSGNAFKGGEGATHLHIGIGHGISNGVGSEGGLGQNFNAQQLLTNLQSGIGQATGAVRAAVESAGAAVQAKVGQGQQEFVSSLQPLAQDVAARTGIDPNAMLAIAANETGWGRSQTAQQQNNLFSIQGDGRNGSRWATYSSPKDAFDAFVNLISSAPRYAQAWADRADPAKFVDDLRNAGYVADEPGFPAQGWVDQVKSIYGRLPAPDAAGPSPQRAAAVGSPVYDVGSTRPAPRAPIYAGVMQPAGDEAAQPFQVIGDTAERAKQAVGGALGAAGEAIGGALGSAGQAIGGAISDVGSGAQQTLSDVGQSGLANQILRSGRTEAEREEFRQRQQEELQRVLDEQRRRDLEPITAQSVATGTWGTIINANPAMGITLDDYLKAQNSKNQWIEQNNPLRDVPVAGGLLTGIAQQLTDPLQVLTFGPTVGLGRAGGAVAGERLAAAAGERLSPQATRMLASVADKFTSGAIVGGLQNALFESEKPGATPQSVGQALLVGAGLGGTIDAAAPAVGRIGRSIMDQAPELRPILTARQRAEGINPFDPPPLPGRSEPTDVAGFRAPDRPANPHRLEPTPPTPDAVPLTADELSDHFDALQTRHDEIADQILTIQEQLAAGRGAQPDRPPWAAGYTNDALQTIARQHGVSAFEQNWWEKAGLLTGSGELRENVGQSGLRGTGKKLQSPTELRSQLRQLETEQQHLLEAANDLTSADDATVFYRRPSPAAEELPFGYPPGDVRAAARPGVEPARPTEPVGGGEAPIGAGESAAAAGPDTGIGGTPEPPPYAPPSGPAGPAELTRAGQETLPGFRTAEPPQPERAVQQPLRMPRPPREGETGATPELDRLNAMYEGKKPAPAGSIADRKDAVLRSLTRALTDRQVDINQAQERYAANLGRPLRADEMAAELQRLASDPAAQVKVDEGLKPAIQAVGQDYPALRNYVTLRSNIEIADNLATRTGKPEIGSERSFSGDLTRDESVKAMQDLEAQLGPERFAVVKAAADQVTAFNKSLRERLVEAGVLDEGTAAQLEAQYPNWAKTRILDYMADPTGGQGAGTKIGLSDRGLREYTLKGTERAREDPVASTVAYAHQVERMAMKNEAFNAFLKIDQASGKPMLREVPQSYTPKSNEVTMIGFVDGQKQKFVTDNQALGAAINGAGVMSTPEWTSAWQKIFRSLATSRNPLFLAGNAALDIPTYVLRQSVREGGPQALPRILWELARGYGDAFQGLLQSEFRGAGTAEFLKGGGGQSGYFTGGEGQSKRAVAEMQRNNVFQIDGWNDLGRLTKDLLTLHPVEALGERIELGPRVAAMRLAERRGENATRAIIDGRTVTVDFSQGGTVTKYLNNFIPFFNVGFQGPAQIARAFRENPRAFVATVGTLLGVPSAAAEVWNKSDPQRAKDYADVPQYVKDQGVVVMLPGEAPVDKQGNRKPMYAVIKLREWAPFAALAREATDRVLGDDTHSWQEVAQSVGTGLSPFSSMSVTQAGTEPLAAVPILPAAAQIAMNRDFFRNRTIVTQRSDENASALSKTLAPQLQAVLDRAGVNAEIRPSAIDFLIRNQGAGVGGAALGASDLAAGEPSDVAGPTGTPVVGGLIGRFAGGQTGEALQRARDETLTTEGRQILRSNGITLTPGAVSSSINQIPINIEEETRYQQLANRYIDEAIQRTAASSDFATKTHVGKQSLMDQAMQAARQKAGIEVLNTIPAAEKQRRIRTKSTAPS